MSDANRTDREDPLIDEVRRLRAELSRECDDDLSKLFDHLRRAQDSMPNPIVRREPAGPQPKQRVAS